MTARTQKQTSPALVIAAAVLVALVAVMGIYIVMGLNKYPSGQPTPNPITGKYTIYAVMLGHRDSTFLHLDLHANIHIDSATLTSIAPNNLPTGDGYFMKTILVSCQITTPNAQPIAFQFSENVGVGAQWGYSVTFQLASGSWQIQCNGVDSDGFTSQSSGGINLP